MEEKVNLPRLTDEQITAIAEGMPDGIRGFTNSWGYLQFARAVEDALRPERVRLGRRLDAARYRWLREWPGTPRDYVTTGLPWVVHIEVEHGVPTMSPVAHETLDAVIDAAIREGK